MRFVHCHRVSSAVVISNHFTKIIAQQREQTSGKRFTVKLPQWRIR